MLKFEGRGELFLQGISVSPPDLKYCSLCLEFSLLSTPTHSMGLRLNVTLCHDLPDKIWCPAVLLLTTPSVSLRRCLTFNCNCFFNGPSPPAPLHHPFSQDPCLSVQAPPAIIVPNTQLVLKVISYLKQYMVVVDKEK